MDPNVAGKFINNIDPKIWDTTKPCEGTEGKGMDTLLPTGNKQKSRFTDIQKVDEGSSEPVQEKVPIWNQITSGLKVAGKVLGTALLAAVAIGTLPVFIVGLLLSEGIGAIAVKMGADTSDVGEIQSKAGTILAAPYLGIIELWGKDLLGG